MYIYRFIYTLYISFLSSNDPVTLPASSSCFDRESQRKRTSLTQSWRIYFSKLCCPSSPSRLVHIRGRLKGERASENKRPGVL